MNEENMLMHYILDEEGNPVSVVTIDAEGNPILENLQKVEACLRNPARQVAENYYLGEAIRISTVFLPIPHIFKDREDGIALYETMVFASEDILKRLLELSEQDDRSIISTVFGGFDIQKRYATREEASKGHKEMCTFIGVCITNGLISVAMSE